MRKAKKMIKKESERSFPKEEESKLENPISDEHNEETAPQEEISSTKEEIEKITRKKIKNYRKILCLTKIEK